MQYKIVGLGREREGVGVEGVGGVWEGREWEGVGGEGVGVRGNHYTQIKQTKCSARSLHSKLCQQNS